MDGITFSRDLYALGHSSAEIARQVRSGDLVPLRRGAYLPRPASGGQAAHRELIRATVAQCSPDAVVSGMSAALIHGLPTWTAGLDRVHLTRDRAGGGRTRRYVEIRGLPLDAAEVTVIDGLAVTSLARTVLDLACQAPMDRAVAIGDAALRLGLRRDQLADALVRADGRRGISQARRSIAFLDERSESVGESRSRVVFHLHGLPRPEPQFRVFNHDGQEIARCDFAWPELNTVGEFDGRVKYQRFLRAGHEPEAELFREKRREDAVRDLSWRVVRWITADIDQPTDLLSRLRRAFGTL